MKKALTILGLGALAVLCALPVLTLGVSAASLYYVMAKCLRRGRGSPFQEFFRAFRQNLLTGLGLTVILALLLVVAYFSRALPREFAAERARNGVLRPDAGALAVFRPRHRGARLSGALAL